LDGLIIGLYNVYTAAELNQEIETWKKRFKKTSIRFSVPQWKCTMRSNVTDRVDMSLADSLYYDFPCPQPYHFLMIRYDGVFGMCCGDDQVEEKRSAPHAPLALRAR